MSFSVGVLYSAQEFTSYVASNEVSVEAFTSAFKKFSLAKPEDILQVSVKCNWIDFHPDGICRITKRGRDLLLDAPEKNLRAQLCDLIYADSPHWAAKIPNGREEVLPFLPIEVHQCFKEAGLLGDWDIEVIEWWDQLSLATRNHKSAANLVTGRRAEKLTMDHEAARTGKDPHWQSLDSNFSGYDILSVSESGSTVPRMIEVKGSTLSRKEAFCYISRNEWKTAETSPDYHFHLWCLKGDDPFLIDVPFEQMKDHIPTDNMEGRWETTRVAFKTFTRTASV